MDIGGDTITGLVDDVGTELVAGAIAAGATGAATWLYRRRLTRRRWRLSEARPATICVPDAASEQRDKYNKPLVGSGSALAIAEATSSLRPLRKRNETIDVRLASRAACSLDGVGDLILLGGPRTNELTREAIGTPEFPGPLRQFGHLVHDLDTVVLGHRVWTSESRDIGHISRDYGVVVRARSPFGPHRMVLLSGAHTHGTVAAARFLAQHHQPVFRSRDRVWILEVDVVDASLGDTRVVHTEPLGRSQRQFRQSRVRVITTDCRAPANSPKPLEDVVIDAPHVIGVIDGVTSKDPVSLESLSLADAASAFPSTGAAAARKVHDALVEGLPTDSPISKREFARIATAALAKPSRSKSSGAAVVAAFHVPSGRVFRIGDVGVLINGDDVPTTPNWPDQMIIAKRSAMIALMLASGQATADDLRRRDLAREALLDDLRAAQRNANKLYGVVNGSAIPDHLIEEFVVPGGAEVVIGSDGYRTLLPTHEDTVDLHQRLIESDPLCVAELAGTKAVPLDSDGYDDMTYVRFRLDSTRWLHRLIGRLGRVGRTLNVAQQETGNPNAEAGRGDSVDGGADSPRVSAAAD